MIYCFKKEVEIVSFQQRETFYTLLYEFLFY